MARRERLTVGDLLDLECSFFENTFSKPKGTRYIGQLFDHSLSREPTQKGKTSKGLDTLLQKHIKEYGKDSQYNKLKELQIALTPSGVFGTRRTYDYLEQQHPLVTVDIDNIDSAAWLKKLKKYPWVIAAAESVSRKGVFALVYIKDPAIMKEHFLALRTNYFPEADDLKDTTRLRYVSYGRSWCRDDDEEAEPFTEFIPLPHDDATEVRQLKPTTKKDTEEFLTKALLGIGTIEETGGLHPWTIRAAARCNRDGLSLKYACDAVWNRIKNEDIIKKTSRYTFERFAHDFHSIYHTYKHEHHIQTKVNLTRSKINRFDDRIYDKAPHILQDLVDLVDQKEEKEVIYFTAICLLGILFPNSCFRYFNNKYYPNLFGYILGEAASFKGKAKIVRQALRPYQKRIDDEFKARQKQKAEDITYNKSVKPGDDKVVVEKIPDLNLFFDGNTSSAAMLKAMQDSPVLVLFETEGDTITKTWKTDWGNYSDIMRKAFEHESLYSLKKDSGTENLMRIRVESPRLSVLVSSTENQMRKVLSADETENGLMSRFLFYCVLSDKKWYNGFESNFADGVEEILTDRLPTKTWFESLFDEDKVYEISRPAQALHQAYFNDVNDNWPEELRDIIAIVRRAGTTCVRLAVLYEELYALESKPVRTSGGLRRYVIGIEAMSLAVETTKILFHHLFVAWQTTYRVNEFKETNVQDADTRELVEKAIAGNPRKGYKAIANALGMSREKVRYHMRKIKSDGNEGAQGGYENNDEND